MEEAVGVWRRHFKSVLNEGGVAEDYGESGVSVADDPCRMVGDDTSLTAEMVCCDVLVDFWWCLFSWCWRNGMVPSEWRRNVIVPICT